MNPTSGGVDTPIHERLAAHRASLSASERAVAEYLASHPDEVALSSAADIGRLTGTSDATVVRTSKALGYAGFRELKHTHLENISRRRNPAALLDNRIGRIASVGAEYGTVIADTTEVLRQMAHDFEAEPWERAIELIIGAGHVVTYGIGPAGCVAEYLSIMLGRMGMSTRSLQATGFRLADDLIALDSSQAIVVFAPLREVREIHVILDRAAEVGAKVILVSEALRLSLAPKVAVALATPQTTTTTASETAAPFMLAHALSLSIGARTRASSVEAMTTLNRLRAEIVGNDIDVHPITEEFVDFEDE